MATPIAQNYQRPPTPPSVGPPKVGPSKSVRKWAQQVDRLASASLHWEDGVSPAGRQLAGSVFSTTPHTSTSVLIGPRPSRPRPAWPSRALQEQPARAI